MKERYNDNKNKITKPLLSGAAIFIILGYSFMGNSETHNSPDKEIGQKDPNLIEITLTPESNLRENPIVLKGEMNNLLPKLDHEITIPGESVAVYDDELNGRWYEVDASNIASLKDDGYDGKMWINKATVKANYKE